ncbi:lysylphosphatidylglycerol synthase transmembrane domain-containing protein [Roseibium sp. M-1]
MALVFLFWLLPIDAVFKGVVSVPLLTFCLVVVVYSVCHIAAAAKLWFLLDRSCSYAIVLKAHWAGLAANLGLPGAVGGDAVRAGVLISSGADPAKTAGAALTDRLIDMVGLAVLATTGAAAIASPGKLQAPLLLLCVFSALLVASFAALPGVLRFVTRWAPGVAAKEFLRQSATVFDGLRRRPARLAGVLAVSMLIQLTFILLTVSLARAIGVNAELGAWIFAWPLAKVIAVLPISLGGLGVREATLSAILATVGADAAGVVAAGLIWHLVLIAGALLGVGLWVGSKGVSHLRSDAIKGH